MRLLVAACAGLLLASPASAQEVIGTVDAVYLEAARGVLLQWRTRDGGSVRRWADVDVDGRKVLVQVPQGMRVLPGERIAVLLAAPKSMPLARSLPTTAVSRASPLAPDPSEHGASVGR
jgi:hypothetical protein